MEWTTYQLSDVCTIKKRGVTPKEGVCYALYSLPAFDKSKKPEIVYGQEIKSNKFSIQNNTILFNKLNVRFKRVWNIKELKHSNNICSTEFFPLSVKGDVEQDFLYYYLISDHITEILKKSLSGTSSSHQRIDLNLFLQLPINLPSISDQRKIAGILSALDSKIENNNKINANLEAQAQALFKSWFVDFTPFKDQPFVDSELGSIPQGWKVGKLGDYCEVKSGYAFKSSWWTNKGYKIIKIKNISENGDINLNDCSCVLPENCDKAKNFIANTGDIVIAMTGATIGKFNIIPKIDEKFYINQRVGKFFLGEKPIEKVPYIYCFLKQENISTQIIQKGQGSAQPNISGADIESIPMLTPMSIILKYNKMCQPLFEKILSNRLESKKLSALRDTLLPKLMSGEIKL